MTDTTTIAIATSVRDQLLDYIHKLEKKKKKRISYSDGIEHLLNDQKET